MSQFENRKRASDSEAPGQRVSKDHRRNERHQSPRANRSRPNHSFRSNEEDFARELSRQNQIQEAEQMREWVAKEDEFVLKQSKKKARIRVMEGRAKSIDWLAVTLSATDDSRDILEDDGVEEDIGITNPASVFDGLDYDQLVDLEKDIETYLTLETNRVNRNYWVVSLTSSLLLNAC